MNTTQTIRIGAHLITIDSDALANLQKYLDALKSHFSTQESGAEIFNDIENRIGEIMTNQLKAGKASVAQNDIEEIITRIGTLEDLGIEPKLDQNNDASSTTANGHTTDQNSFSGRKLTRLANDRIITGLAAGIANYFRVDPVWVRLLVLIFCFTGFGFIIYLAASFLIPKSYDAVYHSKRLMRSLTDKKIAGVCSGLAQYLHLKTNQVRLIFLLPIGLTIIGQISFWGDAFAPLIGAAVLVYFALWILMPVARTNVDKLEMRGEMVNAQTITNQAYGQINNQSLNQTTNQMTNYSFTDPIKFIVKGLAYIFFGILIFTIVAFTFSAFIAGFSLLPFTDYLFKAGNQTFLAHSGWIMVFLTPLAWVILMIGYKISKHKSIPSWVHSGAFISFVVGCISLVVLATDIVKDFDRSGVKMGTEISENNFVGDSVTVIADPKATSNIFFHSFSNNNAFEMHDDSLLIRLHSIALEQSPDNQFHYKVELRSHGQTDKEVQQRLNSLQYSPIWKNNQLQMPLGFHIKKGDVWRGQQAILTIFVPENKSIKFEEDFFEKVANLGIFEKRKYSINLKENSSLRDNIWYTFKGGMMTSTVIEKEQKLNELEEAKEELDQAKTEVQEALNEAKNEAEQALQEAKAALEDAENKTPDKAQLFEKAQRVLDSINVNLQKFKIEQEQNVQTEQQKALDKLKEAEEKLKKLSAGLDTI